MLLAGREGYGSGNGCYSGNFRDTVTVIPREARENCGGMVTVTDVILLCLLAGHP